MVCIDSDVLIDFLNKDKKAVAKIEELRKEGKKIITTTINSEEILRGFAKLKDGEKLDKANTFLLNLKLLNFNYQASKKAAEIFNEI